MRFTVDAKRWSEAVKQVKPFTAKKSTLPVLEAVLIQANGKKLDGQPAVQLFATNLDWSILRAVPVEIAEPGEAGVNAKMLENANKKPKKGTVSVDGDKEHFAQGGVTLPPWNPREFPSLPQLPKKLPDATWTLPPDLFAELVEDVAFACSTELSRPILNGMRWLVGNGQIKVIGCNGHILAQRVITGPDIKPFEMIIPPHPLLKAPFERNQIKFLADTTRLMMTDGETTITTRLIEGPYPNTDQVIPANHHYSVVVDRGAAIEAFKRVLPFASDQTHRVILSVKDKTLSISTPATAEVKGTKETVQLDAVEGPFDKIAFNAEYVVKILKHVRSDFVWWAFTMPHSASMLFPLTTNGIEPDQMFLLMPLRILD